MEYLCISFCTWIRKNRQRLRWNVSRTTTVIFAKLPEHFLQTSNERGVKLLFNFKLSEIRIHAHFLYRRVLHVELK